MTRPARHHIYRRKLRLAIGLALAMTAAVLLIRPEPSAPPDVLQSENSAGYRIEDGTQRPAMKAAKAMPMAASLSRLSASRISASATVEEAPAI